MARLWAFWGGGKDFNPADRALGETVAARFPQITSLAQHRIAFRTRVTWDLAVRGIDQLLVVGVDMPLHDEVHTIAQAVNPGARVVYADADELTMLYADVFYSAEFGGCGFVQAGPDDPRAVLDGAAATLDLDRPVGLLLINSLDLLCDPQAVAALSVFRETLAAGSHIAFCHLTACQDRGLADLGSMCAGISPGPPCVRTPAALETLCVGMERVPPGLVPVPAWRPEPGPWPVAEDVDLWCGVGVLP
ncbi:SAM-dependent methyltransferase [Actinomadura geliboluensis]|uniref:SAM-dependent methyltransferase n=2 Tax=Actinomadura geliboluensis TaxID=882440 RepID=A0A5S4GYY6_9ACTN|nr:SAM-dependent methyltransferase [Actinomadura geliboluensis]